MKNKIVTVHLSPKAYNRFKKAAKKYKTSVHKLMKDLLERAYS